MTWGKVELETPALWVREAQNGGLSQLQEI